MFTAETQVRVRYAETDQMNVVYHGNYAQYFEVGRVEALRALGFPYRRLEDEGILLPVHELWLRYHAPAHYDDELLLQTTIIAMPEARIRFRYELRATDGGLLTEATTTLVFVDRGTGRPMRAPAALVAALVPYFQA